MKNQSDTGFPLAPARFLLPAEGIDLTRWAVIACDQFTSQPEYWRQVERLRAGKPSALDLVYPEAWLSRGDGRTREIHANMRRALGSVLTRPVEGYILVERETSDGMRIGLLGAVDLEGYADSSRPRNLIRPTEATVQERVPPRVRIREGGPLELSHVLLLADDPSDALLGELYSRRRELPLLYDFSLMLDGGRIRGWHIGESRYPVVGAALQALHERGNGLDLAVGDGNHSLAAACACWQKIRAGLSEDAARTHPARWAMAEINDLHSPAIRFHPIHRALFGDCSGLIGDLGSWLERRGMLLRPCADGEKDLEYAGRPYRIVGRGNGLVLGILQPFLDEWTRARPGIRLDYIHGRDALDALREAGAATFALPAMDKADLFPAIGRSPLPRKTFSLGEARDKRYYLEAREIG